VIEKEAEYLREKYEGDYGGKWVILYHNPPEPPEKLVLPTPEERKALAERFKEIKENLGKVRTGFPPTEEEAEIIKAEQKAKLVADILEDW